MNRPEYTDVYKFIASLGVILIGLALLIPWLVLQDTFDLQYTTKSLSDLTPTAQALIATRQATAIWLTDHLVLISAGIGILGLALLAYGTYQWNKRQMVVNRKENAETEQAERNLKTLSSQEILAAAVSEASDDIGHDQSEEITSTNVQEPASSAAEPGENLQQRQPIHNEALEDANKLQAKLVDRVTKAFIIQDVFFKRLRYCFGGAIDVLTNQEFGQAQYTGMGHKLDAIVIGGQLGDAIFELKVFENFLIVMAHQALDQLAESVRQYKLLNSGRVSGVLVIVVTGRLPSDKAISTVNEIAQRETAAVLARITVMILSESDVAHIPCMDIRQKAFGTPFDPDRPSSP